MPSSRLDRAALLGREVHWLLELSWAGQAIRLSTEDLVVPSDDGDLAYAGGLDELRLAEALDFLSQSADPASLAVEAVLPVDVPSLVAQGHDLAAATAELSRVAGGDSYESRLVVLHGRVADPEWGARDEPVAFSIEEPPFEDRSSFPPSRAQVDNATWDGGGISDADRGRPYPWVIGQPGLDYCTGSQGTWCDKRTYWHRLVVAGHPITATQVTINQDNDVGGEVVNVRRQADALGQVVTVVDFHEDLYDSGQANDLGADYQPAVADDVAVFVQFDQGGGGLAGPSGDLMRGAGEVLLWALEQTTLRIDRGRAMAAAPLLDQFKLDFVIDERVRMWDWIAANLLPVLPVSMVTGPLGVYPLVWRYWATASDAVAHLDTATDAHLERASRVRADSSDIRNRLELRYGLSIRTGEFQRVARLSHHEDEKAAVDLRGFGAARVRLTATRAGSWGAGIAVTTTAGGSLVVTENTAARTIQVQFVAGGSTTEAIVTAINAAATMVTALHMQGFNTTWSADEAGQDLATALRRSDGAAGSPYCDVSQRRLARAPGDRAYFDWSGDSLVVYDRSTAQLVLSWMARAHALPRRRVQYQASTEWLWLERGDVVKITDAELHLDAQLALVEEVQADGSDTIGLGLLLLEQLDRDNLEVP
ncbi:MAG: hypothetical protein FJ102_22470 [Deltaproteobacteria bacterium]|nr:hypothetical protein [Deltaproteobacteria bacterium]